MTFFAEGHGKFDVQGFVFSDRNNTCQMSTHWESGDYWTLVLDLVDGELWMETRLMNFNVPESEWGKWFEMSWSFNNRSGTYISHQNYQAVVKNSNTLQFRGLDQASDEAKKHFLTSLASSHVFVLWDTWNKEEMYKSKLVKEVFLDGSRKAINALTRCYRTYLNSITE